MSPEEESMVIIQATTVCTCNRMELQLGVLVDPCLLPHMILKAHARTVVDVWGLV